MGRNVTHPRATWLIFAVIMLAGLDTALFATGPLRVWADCAGCALDAQSRWGPTCWALMAGGVWAAARTCLAIMHWLVWWCRLGQWLPSSRPGLEAQSTQIAVADAVWGHPDFGVLRPWANLSLYGRLERVEFVIYAAFAVWVWLQLNDCHHCPRWAGDAGDTCGRYAYLALAPLVVLVPFAILRAYSGQPEDTGADAK